MSYTTSSTATRTVVPASTSVVTLLPDLGVGNASLLSPANAERKGAIIYNDSTANLFVSLGNPMPSDLTDFTQIIAAAGSFFVPPGFRGPVYGIWATDESGGQARITALS